MPTGASLFDLRSGELIVSFDDKGVFGDRAITAGTNGVGFNDSGTRLAGQRESAPILAAVRKL